jgi:hypothetical protein
MNGDRLAGSCIQGSLSSAQGLTASVTREVARKEGVRKKPLYAGACQPTNGRVVVVPPHWWIMRYLR